MKTTPFALSPLALLLTLAAAGCDIAPAESEGTSSFFCSNPVPVQMVLCESRGRATVVAPEGFALSPTIEAAQGSTCMATDRTCSHDAQVFFQGQPTPEGQSFNFGVTVPVTQGPGRYPLAGQPGFYGSIYRSNPANDFKDYYSEGLVVRSGTLTIERNDASDLRARFDAELESGDGLHRFSLRGGEIDVSDCAVRTVATCYGH